ncbi:MAG: polysaccharide biosynthesis tyrosine autokinase [Anaerolineae bacterium]
MELREYWAIVRRWWWLLLVCMVLGAGTAYVVSINTEPTYEASALLMIGGSLEQVDPTTGDMQTSQRLAQTYAELVKTRTILDAVVRELGLPRRPDVTVSIPSNTQMLRITVADSIPSRAAAAANELGRQLVLQSPSAPERQEQAYREYVHQQIAELQDEMDALSRAIVAENEGGADPDRIKRLEEELNARRTAWSTLLTYLKGSSINEVRIFEEAVAPTAPTKPKVMQNTLLAAVVGLMLAGGAAFLIEYLDDSVRDQRDVTDLLGLPMLGVVGALGEGQQLPTVLAENEPRSPLAEAFRMVRTNLSYALPAQEGARRYLVTSAGPTEGKTTVTANLATVMAQAGQRVILVDADLRRPKLYKAFGVPSKPGLTSYLAGMVASVDDILIDTEVDGVRMLSCGPLPPNAAELLNSARMEQLLDELDDRCEVVLLDSPPLLAVADAAILACMVSGVILVLEAGTTRLEGAAAAMDVLSKAGAKVLGAVLNNVKLRRRGYGSDYYYYYYYYASHDGDQGPTDAEGQKAASGRQRRRRQSSGEEKD